MNRIYFLFLAAAGILFAVHLSAHSSLLNKNNRFQHISIREGLSQSAINCIHQDSRGFMWFGTQDGLNMYDAYDFRVYVNEPENPASLPNNYINTIFESARNPGALWVGTASGLCMFDFETETFISAQNDRRFDNLLKNIPITVIAEDRDGNLWLGTRGKGLNKFDIKTGALTPYRKKPTGQNAFNSINVNALVEDSEGNLLIGYSPGGLGKLDLKTGGALVTEKKIDGLNDDRILSLLCDRDGDIWVGTDGGGLFRLQKNSSGTESLSRFYYNPAAPSGLNSNHINTIYQDRSGLIWIGTNGGGFSSFRKEAGQFENYSYSATRPHGLSHNDVWAIFEDRSGSLWIGTQGGGLNKLDRGYDKFLLYQFEPYDSKGLKHKEIWEIVEEKDGNFLIGTEGGLYRFNLRDETFHHLEHNFDYPNSLSHNRLTSICEDSEGNLWLGSDGGGLYKYIPGRKKFFHYINDPGNPQSLSHDRILSIIEDSTGVMWFGTDGGGCSCLNPGTSDKETLSFTRFIQGKNVNDSTGLSNNRVFAIYEDSDNIIWIGTMGGGLNRFERKNSTFRSFRNDPSYVNSLCDDRVLSINMDSLSFLWIGTFNGLDRFDKKRNLWKHFTTRNGLPNNVIYGVLEETPPPDGGGGNLWISTNKGLAHYDRKTGEFRNYDINDGLQGNEFNTNAYLKSSEGLMLFGGLDGLNVFDPREIKDNPHPPPVVLTDFHIFNKHVPIEKGGHSALEKTITDIKEIRLAYKQNSFSFGFAALNYISPERNRYKYMLQRYDENWIELKKKQMVSYTKVPPGNYVFKVKGSNNDGVWNEKGTEVSIIITPPFWLTWWFKICLVFLFLGVLAILHKRRTTLIRQRLERKRLENELKLKADFTAMLVHDLRSPLSAIIGYSEMLVDMPQKVNIVRTGQVIGTSSNKMLRLINDMLDLSKFEAGRMLLEKKRASLFEVVTESIEVMKPLFHKKEVTLVWEQEPGTAKEVVFMDAEKIGQVVNNFLSNASKYVPKKGDIVIRLSRVGEQFLELSVFNNGPAVPEEEQKYLFDKYAQLKTNVRVKGTGLGLAVSKIIVETHGGTIGYSAGEDGTGSTFYFRLPCIEA
jgi:two-component system sensor histidine kinase ChiS